MRFPFAFFIQREGLRSSFVVFLDVRIQVFLCEHVLVDLSADEGNFCFLEAKSAFGKFYGRKAGCLCLVFVSAGMGAHVAQSFLVFLFKEADGEGISFLQHFAGIAGRMEVDGDGLAALPRSFPENAEASPADVPA